MRTAKPLLNLRHNAQKTCYTWHMTLRRMIVQPHLATRLAPIWRRVAACCAVTVVLLLLLQPLLCVAGCLIEASPALRGGGRVADADRFLCHMSQPDSADHLIIPAFWPGALPALPLIVIAGTLWLRLTLAGPSPLTPRRWAPPTPPPRRSCAA